MINQAWLAYTIAFITADDRLVLQVPFVQERSLFDHGRGYELTNLENSINHMDVTTLKPFRQSTCLDPVAQQIFQLSRIGKMESCSASTTNSRHPNRNRFARRKESYAAHLQPKAKGGFARIKGGNRSSSSPAGGNPTPPPVLGCPL
jgi:hypothetical protein